MIRDVMRSLESRGFDFRDALAPDVEVAGPHGCWPHGKPLLRLIALTEPRGVSGRVP